MNDHAPAAAEPRRAPWRRRLEWLLPALSVLVVAVTPLLVWDRMPEPMAVHWGLGGQPDAAMPRLTDLLLMAFATAAVGFGPLLAARLRMPRGQAQLLVATATGGSALFAILRVVTVRANLDVAGWEAAGALTAPTAVVAVVGAALAGAIGAWLAGDRPDPAPPTSPAAPLDVGASEAVVWTGQATSRVGAGLPVVLLLAAALGAWLLPGAGRTIVLVVLPLLALAMTLLGQVRVVVGPRGLTVALGWLGWPRIRVPITDIAEVSVEDAAPMTYGGWGFRVVPGATAVVIRAGAAIRIVRTSGRVFVVTVDDAARGAGALLAHADARTA